MGLRDIGETLPPGFRFYPSDEELVCHYLYKKVANEEIQKGTLVEVDLHICEPWQLPEVAKLNSSEWYFFSFRDRKYATGYRANRATTSGYWKATGKDRTVIDPRSGSIVGMRKTLVFYQNRAPNGIKSGWIMHEFRLENPHVPPKEDWVLCRVFHKSKAEYDDKLSPQNAFETTAGATSPSLPSSPPNNQTMPCGYHQITSLISQSPPDHHHNHNPNTFLNLSTLNNPSFMHLSQETNNTSMSNEVTSVCEEYRFLYDMGFEESSLVDRVPLDLEEMRFGDHDDNGLVFL